MRNIFRKVCRERDVFVKICSGIIIVLLPFILCSCGDLRDMTLEEKEKVTGY